MPSVRRGLEIMTAPSDPVVRFVPPRLNITLRPWQVRLLGQLNEMPDVRQIFWVNATFTRYREQEYVGGIVNMGECVEMARALQAYRGHALVIWDFPKSFVWHLHKSRVGTILETFSEFGTTAARPCIEETGSNCVTMCCCSPTSIRSRTSHTVESNITLWMRS